MPTREQDPDRYAAQRAYFKRKGASRKVAAAESLLLYDGLSLARLNELLDEHSYHAAMIAAQGADPDLVKHTARTRQLVLELRARGVQGRLFDDVGSSTGP